jgi:hypothetical protein
MASPLPWLAIHRRRKRRGRRGGGVVPKEKRERNTTVFDLSSFLLSPLLSLSNSARAYASRKHRRSVEQTGRSMQALSHLVTHSLNNQATLQAVHASILLFPSTYLLESHRPPKSCFISNFKFQISISISDLAAGLAISYAFT